MNQSQSVAAISDATGMSKSQVKEFFDALAPLCMRTVKGLDTIHLPGIGRLTGRKRAARIGRNPQTGDKIKIKAKRVVKFSVVKALKVAIQ